jgi:hypothetical protein
LSTNKKVTFQWIPSHDGIRHNEEVDELAEQTVHNVYKVENTVLLISDFRTFQRAKLYEQSEISMNVAQTAKWCKNIQQVCPKQPWFSGLRLISDVIKIVRLRTGHEAVNKMLHRFKL